MLIIIAVSAAKFAAAAFQQKTRALTGKLLRKNEKPSLNPPEKNAAVKRASTKGTSKKEKNTKNSVKWFACKLPPFAD